MRKEHGLKKKQSCLNPSELSICTDTPCKLTVRSFLFVPGGI